MEFIEENFEIIGGIVLALLGGASLFFYKKTKTKNTTMTDIKTKSGDVVAGNKTTNK
tara:strand:- start:3060 stop:3230 length:171 start_codon:yes stop_codon:yes gene_type:complete